MGLKFHPSLCKQIQKSCRLFVNFLASKKRTFKNEWMLTWKHVRETSCHFSVLFLVQKAINSFSSWSQKFFKDNIEELYQIQGMCSTISEIMFIEFHFWSKMAQNWKKIEELTCKILQPILSLSFFAPKPSS